MPKITHANIYKISAYSKHLKNLTDQDKGSRFGYCVSNKNIDDFILTMCYHPKEHELWYASIDDVRVGWGHMARNNDDTWELAVSVQKEYQRQGIANMLMKEMLVWAKFHHINEVYMHCIEDNRVIQHLAQKHELKTRERGQGERTAAIEVPEPSFFENQQQLLKEQAEIVNEITRLRGKLTNLWLSPSHKLVDIED
jgi:RimJ/RimL family protein N-acetyltransferase